MGAGGDKPEVKARLKAFPALCLLSSWSVMMISTLEENMRPQRLGTYHLLFACIPLPQCCPSGRVSHDEVYLDSEED